MITPNEKRCCVMCGIDISDRHKNTRYCLECAKQTRTTRSHKKKKRATEKNDLICKIAKMALENGMTYGKYVAKMGNKM